ncbi:hypothetical protein DYB32_005592 [Aphanomyces invadans]|uniref:FYVE-type domain-containing protein n=1 Tax=Aphanomyces invadans TaxID=157072 RepID=A0A3R6Z364_9STRA|nr:hypothetical protein DYB32_005592 [Aphanomyces invadans]
MLFGPQQTATAEVPQSMGYRGETKKRDSLVDGNAAGGRKRRSKNNLTTPTTGVPFESTCSTVKLTARAKDASQQRRTPGNRVAIVEESTMYHSVWNALQFKVVESSSASSVTSTAASATHPFLRAAHMKMPICVTGIDSFLGSWIVTELLQRGYKVRGTVQSRKDDDISRLLELPHASTQLMVVETSLLTPESCDLAVEGCEYVIHTGTPSSCAVRDPVSEVKVRDHRTYHENSSTMQEPGVHSVSSRMHCIVPVMTNFIKACVRARIKKVRGKLQFAISYPSRNPHFLGLKVAEEKAWQLVEQEPKLEMVTICVRTLMGPSVCTPKSIPPGNQVVYDLITGQYSAIVDLSTRFYILRANGYSGRALPFQVGLPNWVARLSSFSAQLGQVGVSLYGDSADATKPSPYLSDRLVDVLRLSFRDVKSTIVECAGDLLKWKFIKPWGEDREAILCACCDAPFNFLRRRHHCRECGVVVCGDCSQSRAVVEGLDHPARLCDACVQSSIPALLELMHAPLSCHKAVKALESLMVNPANHELITRCSGVPILLKALHEEDDDISFHAAGTLLALSEDTASALQMVLEGAVLHMLEVDQTTETWRSNILITFVHMMEPRNVCSLLKEGLLDVLFVMLKSANAFDRCAAAHAVVRVIPVDYDPDTEIDVPPYQVDDHEELLTLSTLSDIQFLVKGHIAPINAHKIVLFVRNAYFKNMFGSSNAANPTKRVIEIDNCTYSVFSMILRFLYTGKLAIDDVSAQDLLRAAAFYQVVELRVRIEKFLADRIAVANVVELLSLANECNAEGLRRACIPFLMQNIHAVVKLDSFAAHREWAGQEILLALTLELGDDWYAAYQAMVAHPRHQPAYSGGHNVVHPPTSHHLHHAPPSISSHPPASATMLSPLQLKRPTVVSPLPSKRLILTSSPMEKGGSQRSRLLSEESLAEGIC